MGFIEDKNSIVQQVSLFEVLGDLPENKTVSNIASVKSKSFNLIPYLLDLLSVTCKDKEALPNLKDRVKCDLIRIVIEILVEFFPILMRILKEGIIKGIKAGLLCPADFKVPSPAPMVELKPDEFDTSKLTTLDVNSFPSSLFFGDPDKDLNVFLANLLQGGVGGSGTWQNILDFEVIDYTLPNAATTTGLRVQINNAYVGVEYDVFLKDFVNSIELFNFDNFIPNLMEQFNGAISNLTSSGSAKLSIDSAIDKEKVDSLVEKILSTDPCDQNFLVDDSFFEFSPDELLDIEKKAQNRLSGVKIIDYSCAPTLVLSRGTLDEDGINNVKKSIKENPNSSSLVMKQYAETVLDRLAKQVSADDDENESIKKSLSFELALALPKLSASVIFTPKIKVLFQISKKLVTNTIDSLKNNFDFAIANSVFFEYVVREAGAALLELIFDAIKEEILKVVIDLVKSLVKEAINKKLDQLRSLTGGYSAKSGLSAVQVPDISEYI
jgi:hypothetical protein